MGSVLSGIGSAIGIASGAKGLLDGGGKKAKTTNTPYYKPIGLNEADTSWLANMRSQNALNEQYANQINPALLQSFQQQSGINYNPLLQAGQQAGQAYGNLAPQAAQYSQMLQGLGQQQIGQVDNLMNAGNQLWQTAQDPRHELYNRTRQQLGDQINAGQAQRGLGNSAVGGAEYNQGMRDFNIDWQNQQLARQSAGLQGLVQSSNAAGRANQYAGADLTGALGLSGQIPGFMLQSAQTPIDAQNMAYGAPGQVAANYAQQLQNGPQTAYGNFMGQIIPYLNQGTGVQSTTNRQALPPSNPFTNWANLSQGIQDLSSLWQQPPAPITDATGQPGYYPNG